MAGMMTGLPGKLGLTAAAFSALAGVVVTRAYIGRPHYHPHAASRVQPSLTLGATLSELETPEGRRLVVTSLRTGGPGAEGGLRVGDRIERVAGFASPGKAALKKRLANRGPQGIDVEIGRDSGMFMLHIPPAHTELGE
ncbi:MAG TPA: signaling protein [Sphingomonadaceae bacterium]|nr:signaling protein [Sphingomonadaceae bacterium]